MGSTLHDAAAAATLCECMPIEAVCAARGATLRFRQEMRHNATTTRYIHSLLVLLVYQLVRYREILQTCYTEMEPLYLYLAYGTRTCLRIQAESASAQSSSARRVAATPASTHASRMYRREAR